MTETAEQITEDLRAYAGNSEGHVSAPAELFRHAADRLDAQQMGIDALKRIHRESHNEYYPEDGWPSGHCNRDGEDWPCSTIRLLEVGEQ